MKASRFVAALSLLVAAAGPAAAQTGDLKIRFEYGGNPFKPANVNVNKDVEYCGKFDLKSETLVVNDQNKGIKNVLVHVYTGRGGSDIEESDPRNETLTLANDQCRFEPHIVLAQKGDTLKVTNPDKVVHNANLQFFANKAQNLTIPPGSEIDVELEEAERAPMPVACNIHPWMKAYVFPMDHTFGALSDENGELTIKGLPAGEEYVFRIWLEASDGSLGELMIDGEEVDLGRRNTFEWEIEEGMNDLGTVVIPEDVLAID